MLNFKSLFKISVFLFILLLIAGCSDYELNMQEDFKGSGDSTVIHLDPSATINDYKTDNILVKVNRFDSLEKVTSLVNGNVAKSFSTDQAQYAVITLPNGTTVSSALQLLEGKTGFMVAEPNYIAKHSFVPNDTDYSKQYSHLFANSQTGWDISTGGNNVTIAVLDTGVNGTHPDLQANMINGYNTFENKIIPSNVNGDDHGHGTHVAGIAAARGNNANGIAGVSWNCKIMSVKVLNEYGGGTDASVAEGIVWAIDNKGSSRMVINMSLGGSFYSQLLFDAVNYAIRKGIVVVAAMGNSGYTSILYPAAYRGVMAVGSSNKDDQISYFSTGGAHISVAAPGSDIYSTSYNGSYVEKSGTSMATSFVAGLCSLLLSRNSSLTPGQVKSIIEQTADDKGVVGFDNTYGHGRVNAGNTLKAVGSDQYGVIMVNTANEYGLPITDIEVLLCNSSSNVIRSILTSNGVDNNASTIGSAFFYLVPIGNYIMTAGYQGQWKSQVINVSSSHTIINPATVLFSYTTPSGPTFGIYTETFDMNVLWDTDCKLDVWQDSGGGADISEETAVPLGDGNKYWKLTGTGSWMGIGVRVEPLDKYRDLRDYYYLNFMYRGYKGFRVGMKDGNGDEYWLTHNQLAEYGVILNGKWCNVSIPLTKFNGEPFSTFLIDKTQIEQYFMFVSVEALGYNVGDVHYIDNVHFSKAVGSTSSSSSSSSSSTPSTFGIYSESVRTSVLWDFDTKLDIWQDSGGGADVSEETTASFGEGVKYWKFFGTGFWMGIGIGVNPFVNYRDLSAYNYMNFMYRGTRGGFKIGMKSSIVTEGWLTSAQLASYGLVQNGNWSTVKIPLSAFGSINLSKVQQYFMFVSDFDMGYFWDDTHYFDHLYFSVD